MKGVYVLHISVSKDVKLKVGSLGSIDFKQGSYAYVGSAQNNLEKRVNRHLSKEKKMHWHIDYLLNNKCVKVTKVFYNNKTKLAECRIASNLCKTEEPIINFGCSDCNCNSHLFKIKNVNALLNQGMKTL